MLLTLAKDLVPLRAAAKARVDAEAEAFRANFATPGSGQAMTYQEKYDEACAFLADPDIDPVEVPHIYAEIGTTAPTAYEVAQVVVNMRSLWKMLSAAIDGARLGAKDAIDQAATPAAIDAAADIDFSAAVPAP